MPTLSPLRPLVSVAAALALGAGAACSSGEGQVPPPSGSGDGGTGGIVGPIGPGAGSGGSPLQNVCPSGEIECGDACCGGGFECVDGTCSCPSGFEVCGASCVDTTSNANHCGGCDQACEPGQSCEVGMCSGGAGCDDACPVAGGVPWGCNRRFMYGVNYAWHHFAADFGGIPGWGLEGVSQNPNVETDLAEMAANGASVIRWWVFPSFRGEAVTLDGSGSPNPLGGTAVADLQRALELADQHGIYLMLCLFSFDNFEPEQVSSGIRVPSMHSIATDPTHRVALVDNVVRPFARAAEASPHRDHLIAWDVINEPEGAMHGASKYGDPGFPSWGDLESLSHDEMEVFIADVIAGLRQESSALVTVGGLEMMYARAWSQVDIDFYQFHNYGSWDYRRSPADFGITDKPVILGEFPWDGLDGAGYAGMLQSLYDSGYAGALTWQYNEQHGQLGAIAEFANQHPCETHY